MGDTMRVRFGDAPWWALSLAVSILYAVGLGMFSLARQSTEGMAPAVVVGLPTAAAWGAAMGVVLGRMRARAQSATGHLPPDLWQRAVSAAGKGPVPEDPAEQASAIRLVQHRLAIVVRQRRWSIPMFALLAIVTGRSALAESPWWWLGSAEMIGFLILAVLEPARLTRRLRDLSA